MSSTTTCNVMNDRTVTISNNNADSDKGNETHAQTGQPDHHADMGNQISTLKMGNQTTKVNLGKISEEAMQPICLKWGQSRPDQSNGVTIKGMIDQQRGKPGAGEGVVAQ
jgi:type VI secretion system secreted protein VgrG